jgi:hypothetical protein
MEKILQILMFVLPKEFVCHLIIVLALMDTRETIVNIPFAMERILQIQVFVLGKELVQPQTIVHAKMVTQVMIVSTVKFKLLVDF